MKDTSAGGFGRPAMITIDEASSLPAPGHVKRLPIADMTAASVVSTLQGAPGGLGLRALRSTTGLRKQTVCRVLKGLVESGTVEREPKPLLARDGRRREGTVYVLADDLRLSRHRYQRGSSSGHFTPGPPQVLRYPGGKSKMIRSFGTGHPLHGRPRRRRAPGAA